MTITFADGSTAEAVRRYTTPTKRETAGEELDRRVRANMRETKRSYSESMTAILNVDPALKRRYADGEQPSSTGTTTLQVSPGIEVHRKILDLRRRLPDLTYAAALDQVLAADPALRARFAQEVNTPSGYTT